MCSLSLKKVFRLSVTKPILIPKFVAYMILGLQHQIHYIVKITPLGFGSLSRKTFELLSIPLLNIETQNEIILRSESD